MLGRVVRWMLGMFVLVGVNLFSVSSEGPRSKLVKFVWLKVIQRGHVTVFVATFVFLSSSNRSLLTGVCQKPHLSVFCTY